MSSYHYRPDEHHEDFQLERYRKNTLGDKIMAGLLLVPLAVLLAYTVCYLLFVEIHM